MTTQAAGFDRTEPRTRFIALFGLGTFALLVIAILWLQSYVDRVREQEIFVKVEEPVSADLKALHAREDEQLYTYRYIDRAKGTVRIPIDRAMALVVQEAHAPRN